MIKKLLGLLAASLAWFAALVLGATLMSPRAQAQVTEPPPACNPFTEGLGHVVGRAGGAEGVHWWCRPADDFADWVPSRASRLIGAGQAAEVRGSPDVATLTASRTLPTTAPEFAPLWASMAPAVAQSKPAPRWRVAPVASGTRQAYRVTEAGTLSDMGNFRIAVGTPCNCVARVSSGSSNYCQAGLVSQIVALCAKSP